MCFTLDKKYMYENSWNVPKFAITKDYYMRIAGIAASQISFI